ncbi:hypothetical protein [Methylobacterium brachiatum]|jgi:hypothetical protein|uniref:hypothetical protein n=1 Tax=Methylobacterium brachiatum TaxID=269660 RepID=UPI002447B215|nr:hypothetical protein [Methylobacterium brachiatum]MDH2310811.1 hypothetical protein [Methylobacterium brachiatum]
MSTTDCVSIAADVAGKILNGRSKFVPTFGSADYHCAAGRAINEVAEHTVPPRRIAR